MLYVTKYHKASREVKFYDPVPYLYRKIALVPIPTKS